MSNVHPQADCSHATARPGQQHYSKGVHAAGDTLSITIARDGQMQTVNVTLGEKTDSNS